MTEPPARASEGLRRLIDANAPFWAGEAEVFRAYWDSGRRSRETDLIWLFRQCFKEYWDGFMPRLERLNAGLSGLERDVGRREALQTAEDMVEELAHYCAFAEVYDAVRRPDEARLDPETLKHQGDWPENAALGHLRAEHKRTHSRLGHRAQAFSEGGYCTLFSEGAALEGRGGVDDLIADACAKVYDDEFDHMLQGIAGLDAERLNEAEWDLLVDLSTAQMRQRVLMRNAQFSHPLPETRVREILAGDVDSLPFDYARAGLSAS